ncbi:uncharacterized protein LOC108671892 [Hyalella azteca]|uniref:Uncharacterized protein LOC108671892 n=1 Tax=Hyalella azteca TaxID=294128 RepID=A0A8B7NMT0_HYAAZ|nr:uncharacterized protein LOC108671892 [Hyalella azteca]
MKSIIFGLFICLVAARVPMNRLYASQIQAGEEKTWNIEENISEHAKNAQMSRGITYQDNTTICFTCQFDVAYQAGTGCVTCDNDPLQKHCAASTTPYINMTFTENSKVLFCMTEMSHFA